MSENLGDGWKQYTLRKGSPIYDERGEIVGFTPEDVTYVGKTVEILPKPPEGMGNIAFHIPALKDPLIELCANGDIKVRGKIIENDKELVDALREFLKKGTGSYERLPQPTGDEVVVTCPNCNHKFLADMSASCVTCPNCLKYTAK